MFPTCIMIHQSHGSFRKQAFYLVSLCIQLPVFLPGHPTVLLLFHCWPNCLLNTCAKSSLSASSLTVCLRGCYFLITNVPVWVWVSCIVHRMWSGPLCPCLDTWAVILIHGVCAILLSTNACYFLLPEPFTPPAWWLANVSTSNPFSFRD